VIDELPAVAAIEHRLPDEVAPVVERRLSTGERFRAVKVFYEPAVLEQTDGARLAGRGVHGRIALLLRHRQTSSTLMD
jgi:hypothetical protein